MTYATMAVLAAFYITFLSQIFLLSIYYPAKLRRRILYVLDNYPPAQYPKLYPKPMGENAEQTRRKKLRTYRTVNYVIAVIGLIILTATMASGYRPDVKGGDEVFVLMYFFLQASSCLYIAIREYNQYRLMREAFADSSRKAQLSPRRLFNFISPIYIALAVLLYITWIVFYLSEAGLNTAAWEVEVYITLIVSTGMNILFAGAIAKSLRGKKVNPYQAHKDQLMEIGAVVKVMVFASMAGSTVHIVTQAVDQYGLEIFDPVITSVYLQLCVVFGFGLMLRTLKVESVDFDVYKDDATLPTTSG